MDKRFLFGSFVSTVFIGIMAAASQAVGSLEVIFPEAAALLLGSFIMPAMPWKVKHIVMTAEMTFCAAAGLVISRYMEAPVYFKMLLAAAVVFLLLPAAGNTLTPSVSACVLPVLVGARAWIYVVSVAVTAAVYDLGSYILERRGKDNAGERSVSRQIMIPLWSRMFPVLAVILLLPGLSGQLYFTAPPLIVAFTALCGPGMAGRDSKNPPVKTILLFFLTSSIGYLCRLLCDNTALPLAVCVMLAALAAWTVITASGRYFPPAAALAVLPFILPATALWRYPLEVTAGIAIYYAGALIVDLWMRKNNKR